jgi:hypothetical protein
MIIDFEKTIIFHAEVDDEQFKNESGNIDEDIIINFCEMTDTPTEDNHCWVHNDELKNITYVDSSNNIHKITESEYEHYRLERERAERCYECEGYGDDYDYDGNCNCDDCPFNSYEDDEYFDNYDVKTSINPTEFISSFCNKVIEFYEGFVDKQSVINKVKMLFKDTKFSYIEINSNNRIFLFAENPTIFIKDNNLWNYLQNWVNEKYNTFIAIGMYISNGIDLSNDCNVIPIFNIIDYIK